MSSNCLPVLTNNKTGKIEYYPFHWKLTDHGKILEVWNDEKWIPCKRFGNKSHDFYFVFTNEIDADHLY